MATEVRIRPMQPGDLDAVRSLAAGLPQAPQWPRSAYEAVIGLSGSRERIALVAELAGTRIAGFVIACLLAPEAELESIAVAEEYQRHGVARALVAELKLQLATSRCWQVVLEVRASNAAAQAFYRRMGFEETGCRPGYYASPVEDAVLMSLDIPPATAQL